MQKRPWAECVTAWNSSLCLDRRLVRVGVVLRGLAYEFLFVIRELDQFKIQHKVMTFAINQHSAVSLKLSVNHGSFHSRQRVEEVPLVLIVIWIEPEYACGKDVREVINNRPLFSESYRSCGGVRGFSSNFPSFPQFYVKNLRCAWRNTNIFCIESVNLLQRAKLCTKSIRCRR